jgi:hypothetical protein
MAVAAAIFYTMRILLLYSLLLINGFGATVRFEWDSEPTSTYYILTATTNGTSWSVTTTNTAYSMTDLVVGVEHTFQVFGVNEFGVGPGSVSLQLTPSDPIIVVPALERPANIEFAGLLVTQSPQWSLQLKWSKVTNAVSYLGEVRVTNSVVYSAQTTEAKIQIPKLRFNETNYVYLKAVDSEGGQSEWSDPYTIVIKRDFDAETNLTLHAILKPSK